MFQMGKLRTFIPLVFPLVRTYSKSRVSAVFYRLLSYVSSHMHVYVIYL